MSKAEIKSQFIHEEPLEKINPSKRCPVIEPGSPSRKVRKNHLRTTVPNPLEDPQEIIDKINDDNDDFDDPDLQLNEEFLEEENRKLIESQRRKMIYQLNQTEIPFMPIFILVDRGTEKYLILLGNIQF